MNDENPYASPATTEPEAPPSRVWQLDGIGVLVKNQAVLPPVDLNTGETGEGLKCVRRAFVKQSPGSSILYWGILLGYVFLSGKTDIGTLPLMTGLFVILFLFKQVQALRASPSQRLNVMEYIGPRSIRGYVARGAWRRRIYFLLIAAFIFSAAVDHHPDTQVMILFLAFGGFFANLVWAIVDKPPARSQAGPPGWMRISPIHPDAARHLAELQKEEPHTESTTGETRKRNTRTTYFHKYPLGILLAGRKNPLVVFNIIVAKLLRSPLLARDTFHHSEAVTTDPENLCPPLREKIDSWITAHPDWTLRETRRLVSPDGDIIVENAHLAPPSHEHELCLTCSWNLSAPARRILHGSFFTWLRDGGHVSTHDHPFIRLQIPGYLPFHTRGDLEQIYQEHLRHSAGLPGDPPADEAGRAARFNAMQETIDRRLTELGYQSELR
jgi:hypothetical protein